MIGDRVDDTHLVRIGRQAFDRPPIKRFVARIEGEAAREFQPWRRVGGALLLRGRDELRAIVPDPGDGSARETWRWPIPNLQRISEDASGRLLARVGGSGERDSEIWQISAEGPRRLARLSHGPLRGALVDSDAELVLVFPVLPEPSHAASILGFDGSIVRRLEDGPYNSAVLDPLVGGFLVGAVDRIERFGRDGSASTVWREGPGGRVRIHATLPRHLVLDHWGVACDGRAASLLRLDAERSEPEEIRLAALPSGYVAEPDSLLWIVGVRHRRLTFVSESGRHAPPRRIFRRWAGAFLRLPEGLSALAWSGAQEILFGFDASGHVRWRESYADFAARGETSPGLRSFSWPNCAWFEDGLAWLSSSGEIHAWSWPRDEPIRTATVATGRPGPGHWPCPADLV